MVQELIELRNNILQGRYPEALELLDELEGMGRQAILRNIQSYLLRLLIHLIKNQVEQRLTNSWAASIRDSVICIQRLNLKGNKTSYYIKQDEWESYLSNGLKDAIFAASVEIFEGQYKPRQLQGMVDHDEIIRLANRFLSLTYTHSKDSIRDALDAEFIQLPGGEDWV